MGISWKAGREFCVNRAFCFWENKRTAESSKRSGIACILDWEECERVERRTRKWKDRFAASYICVEILSVLFYPNYSLLLCFVKINIYYQSKYMILQFLGARPGLDKTYHKFWRLSGLNRTNWLCCLRCKNCVELCWIDCRLCWTNCVEPCWKTVLDWLCRLCWKTRVELCWTVLK